MRGNKKYMFILGVFFIFLILIQVLAPRPVNWAPSYLKKDRIPFGTSALFEMLPYIFPGQDISTQSLPAYNALSNSDYFETNYIVINNVFQPDKFDSRELLYFVEAGNSVFVAANAFDGELADSLKIKTDAFYSIVQGEDHDSLIVSAMLHPFDTADINFSNPQLRRKPSYSYSKGIENSYFTSFDSSHTTILGNNTAGKINFIRIRWGEGNFYLSTVPEVFSNYLFTDRNNYDYAYKALSYLPVQKTIWDEYYKAGNVHDQNPLRVIFRNPALKAAYYLLLGSLLLFMIIGIKRKQRIIPVIEPLRNTTLDFVNTVGTLYYQAGSHKNIADKKISYFLEYIRSAFQVRTNLFDDAFIDRITNLSGIERRKIVSLFYYFSELSAKSSISEKELLKLNKMIEDFHKENIR